MIKSQKCNYVLKQNHVFMQVHIQFCLHLSINNLLINFLQVFAFMDIFILVETNPFPVKQSERLSTIIVISHIVL